VKPGMETQYFFPALVERSYRGRLSESVGLSWMDSQELVARFEALGVPRGAYSVGLARDESYCLVHEGGTWAVFYSERGSRNDEAAFSDEDRICREMFERVTQDRIVQRANGTTQ
jgi:hypothetical protein